MDHVIVFSIIIALTIQFIRWYSIRSFLKQRREKQAAKDKLIDQSGALD